MNDMSSLSLAADVTLNPLKKNSNISAINSLEKVILSSVGPYGKLKVIKNIAGGQVTATTSSQRLLSIMSIKNTFLKLIVSTAKSHLRSFSDGGLICTLTILKLIKNSLASHIFLPLIGSLMEHFGKLFISFLSMQDNLCVVNMDLSNLNALQSLVWTILQSKPACMLSESDLKHLSVVLIKAHLNSIPSSFSMFYHKNINITTLEGTCVTESKLLEGLIIRLPEPFTKSITAFKNETSIKIVLFTVSLSGDADFPAEKIEVRNGISVWESVLRFLKNIVENIIKMKIHVFACQKVVHPSLRKQLEEADVLVLDRLGHEVSKNLEYLSGSSNTSLFSEISVGTLTTICLEKVGTREFLLLNNKSKPLWTVLICNFNEQSTNETKVVCQQVLDTLFRLLKNPRVCYGAGCTEFYTSRLVEKEVINNLEELKLSIGCTSSQILEALKIFLQSIIDVALGINQSSTLNIVSETVFNHLWKLQNDRFPSQSDKCLCGQYTAKEVDISSWRFLNKNLGCMLLDSERNKSGTQNDVNRSVILDEVGSKVNAFSVAFEAASLILKTSICITNC